jgi:poly [ADP-ribose] polymerase
MFDKGIYFADMVTKSANYCCTSKSSPTGLLLLCEVALGRVIEYMQADYNASMPVKQGQGHSTKGVGATHPDPSESVKHKGAIVPLGNHKTSEKQGALLYNEYIVYDPKQVKMRYLVRTRFEYNYHF